MLCSSLTRHVHRFACTITSGKLTDVRLVQSNLSRASWQNPLGRMSMSTPTPNQLQRASVVMVNDAGVTRGVPHTDMERKSMVPHM